jgi:hypothetical protein
MIFPDSIHRTWDHWLDIFAWRVFVARIKDDILGLWMLDMTGQARFVCLESLHCED